MFITQVNLNAVYDPTEITETFATVGFMRIPHLAALFIAFQKESTWMEYPK